MLLGRAQISFNEKQAFIKMPYFYKAYKFQHFIYNASYFYDDFFEYFQNLSSFYLRSIVFSKDKFIKQLKGKYALEFYYSFYRIYEFFYCFFDIFDEKIQEFFTELKHKFLQCQRMIFQNQDLYKSHFFSQKLLSFLNSQDFYLFLVNLEFFIHHAFLFQAKSVLNYQKKLFCYLKESIDKFLTFMDDFKHKKLFEIYYRICILFEILNPFLIQN
ncbi:hypothetical protein OLQ22_05495 [Campylobacter jejuni]|nr:hypothetical protein [Campylobacter jejuni]